MARPVCRAWVSAVSAVAVILAPATALAQDRRVSTEQKREVAEAAARAYADFYVFEDRGRLIAEGLRAQSARGAFDGISRSGAFAEALTSAIRAIQPDRHIEVLTPQPRAEGPQSQTRAQELAWVERLRRRNYDFVRVERLPGNVGVLRLDSFPPPELAAPTAAAAMVFLQNSDAIVVDLRENGGGTGDMVRFLASYFFVEPTRLSRTFRRSGNPQVTFDSTLASVPGERMPIVDVFVLTSSRTISAAEGFAFAMQQLGRAVVVGERTAGAGNAGNYVDIGHGFSAFVPDVAVSSPSGDATWDGVGVAPDIGVPAQEALAAAHREAVRRLLAQAPDARTREALTRALETPVQ